MARERELKFSSASDRPPTETEIVAVLRGGGYRATPQGELLQRDRYFDDGVGSLGRAGIALRRRRRAGERLATLKTAGSVRGALHEREEIELPLSGSGWPAAIETRLKGIVDMTMLRSRITLETRRDRYLIERDGAAVAELSFDDVAATRPGGNQQVHFSEVEIEALEEGDERELTDIAALLEQVIQLNPSGATKLERAAALLELATWGS